MEVTMSFIDANEISLQDFLNKSTEIFKLPLYQRPYAWTKDQWTDLLEDVLSLSENDIHFFANNYVNYFCHRYTAEPHF